MSDSHNDDPFAPPPPPPPPFPERVERFSETPPVERFGEIPRAERFGEVPIEASWVPPAPAVEPLPAAAFGEGGYAPPAPSGMTLAPADPLTGEPALVAASAEPRLALDGTSVWLNRLGEELVAWLKTLASAAVYATLIVTFGFQVARVEGMSMAPTLQDQDRLIVNKLAYRIGDPKVGDIVMLYYPLKPEKSFVKRIIAEEGDQVRIVDGKVFRNDVQLDDSFVPADYRSHDDWGPQVIPEGYYFVMGDHRNNSSDSRHWGFVPKKYIIGKVQLRWWPMGHAKVF
jgi:signal peptidase I